HFGGTSGATPLVAGICALMLSANPNLSAREVKEILIQTADKIGSPSEYIAGHSRKYGYGRVNAERAVAEALRRKSTGAGLPSTPSTPTSPVSTPAGSGNAGAGGTASPSGNLFEVNLQQVPKTGWGVQVGAFSSYDSVLSLVNQYKSKFGQPVFVHVSTANGKSLYKIIVGSFPTTQQAAAFQAQMQRNGVSGFVKNFADL
ncbi:MAG: SPOR domain-containing protein, partial [Haliscomenobacter sp.]|nr:SPOR domain-containing protein [Haliscomenobacter sp.]MBP9872476.1 SPOR domain-containing protein [Haliscomenobacter sp.]